MRAIKFRVWDGEFLTSAATLLVETSDGTVWKNIGWNSDQLVEAHGAVVMQFTGLHDKDGREIYEGDVVYLAGFGNYVVEFPFIELYESGFEGDIGNILGNIHENPELMQ